MTRVVLFGDGLWASLAVRAMSQAGYDVTVIVGRRKPTGNSLYESAEWLGATYLQPADPSSAEVEEVIARAAPDILLSIAYDRVIPRHVLALARTGALNVHAGILPRYRGCNVITWAIVNGESTIGLTVHYMDEHLDTGPILTQQRLPIGTDEGYGEILLRVTEAIPGAVLRALPLAVGGDVGSPQDSQSATYFPRRRDGDEDVNWSLGSAEIHNLVRGVTRPGPGARTWCEDGRELRIWRTNYDSRLPSYRSIAGVVLEQRPGNSVLVTTGNGVLELVEVEVVGSERTGFAPGTRLRTNTA